MIWVVHHAYNLATKRDVSNDSFLKNPVGEEGAPVPRDARARGGLLTLSVERATQMRSAAVARGGRPFALRQSEPREGLAAAGVLEDIDRALAEACVRLEDVELFAAANGPGSFTGLRSGLATLKALAVTLGKPLVGVPTLHALAHAARPAERLLALIPAGRGEVFAQTPTCHARGRRHGARRADTRPSRAVCGKGEAARRRDQVGGRRRVQVPRGDTRGGGIVRPKIYRGRGLFGVAGKRRVDARTD
ncbi:MAG: tRNA (adenosine(37)-N6)-threonylcarbamoyltransferase complex dimerization subunit type 1 TsaB [Acidobacteria bacterium]|nr:MAG: tRNA (adenosine(37)-N6)-threonylcarbamoyltransferase complex dimerization subunit type 1 TsaB [Acidobacteriota bacterium]PYS85494.1 MAG: tRNA (adenosine(37)-N6)-threonylcarbamoyltransferase complex dimerization subunit type 1 TsaB [Acidobacteriota bacterium]